MNKTKVENRRVTGSTDNFPNKQNFTAPVLMPIPWSTRIFGCWHKKMGIPFTRGNQTYRACIFCGACQNFDVKSWRNVGPFYYKPVLALYDSHKQKT